MIRIARYLLKIILPVTLAVTVIPVSADIMRDPTRPPDVAGNTSPSKKRVAPKLDAIIISANQNVAVVNNTIVKAGDVVNDYRVISIAPGKVELEGPGGNIQLLIPAQSVKK